jgi:outer membrane protein assembly factor BamB
MAVVCALGAPAVAGDWTTAYAGLARTSYLAGEAVAPPFALAWEYTSELSLKGAPLVALGRTYLCTEQYYVWSLDINDGSVKWKHDEPRAENEVRCYDALSGEQRWTAKVPGKLVHTPQVMQTVVYAASSEGSLSAFNQFDGKLMWSVPLAAPVTLASADASLVVIGAGTTVAGLDPKDGKTLFTADLGGPATAFPALAEEGFYVLLGDGVVALDRAGKERWRVPLAKPAWAPPAVTKAGVLVGSVDGAVVLLSRDAGAVVWKKVLAGTPSALSGAADTVYVGTRQGTIVGLRLSDGAKLWSADLGHGPIDGAALAGGRMVVTAGKWVAALLPAPEAPANVRVAKAGGAAVVNWDAPVPNASPLSAYRVWRRRGQTVGMVGVVPAASPSFRQDQLPGDASFMVSAVAANGAESVRSGEAGFAKGEPLIRRLSLAPMPYDPATGALTVSFDLRTGARVTWFVVDAEGLAVTAEKTEALPAGPATLSWNGMTRQGLRAEPGAYQARLKAVADLEADSGAKTFLVAWDVKGPGTSGLAPGAGSASTVGGVSGGGAPTGGQSSPGGSASGGGDPSGKPGVRDHGQGEGKDGAGQGKGQGLDKK